MRRFAQFISVLIVALFPALTFAAGFAAHWYLTRDQLAVEVNEFKVFWEAWRLLDRTFLGEAPGPRERTYSAIHGLVSAYEDPYTVFVEPQPRQREREELRGEFGGIGAWVTREPDGSYSLRPMPNLPAATAGIREGDILIAVDGQPITTEMSQDEVINLIRGPVGATVRIEVRRSGVDEPLAFTIKRQRIETPSVQWRMLDDPPHAGYIQITIFTERTAREMAEALRDLKGQGMQKLVLDLRHNGGGLLDAAIDVSSIFLREGVVLHEQKAGGAEKSYPVRRQPVTFDGPVVILVDNATASASEIVAGALQDYGRGVLLGEKTFGKGSVQLVHDLSDGSSLHITAARWLTPQRRRIDQEGLQPDILVVVSEEDRQAGRDPVLEQAQARLAATP